jgi:hypothetical protein
MTSLGQAFETFQVSAFRLETLPVYDVPEEADEVRAFLAGEPSPECSVRTSPWLARMATSTVAGRDWRRLRLLSTEPVPYETWELDRYLESQACGEQIRILARDLHQDLAGGDFWMFDAGHAGEAVFAMRYSGSGRFIAADRVVDSQELAACRRSARLWDSAPGLNTYLTPKPAVSGPTRRPGSGDREDEQI